MQLSKKKKNRIIALSTATLLTISTIAAAWTFGTDKAYAKVTLRGIDDIATEHTVTDSNPNPDPFVILEVVPKHEDATFGYLVAGEEPVFDGKSIKDMPSKAERLYRLTNGFNPSITPASDASDVAKLAYELNTRGAFGWYPYEEPAATNASGKKELEIRGVFNAAKDHDGWYSENDFSGSYLKKYGDVNYDSTLIDVSSIYDDKNVNKEVLYQRTDAFREADSASYKGTYSLALRKITDEASEIPVLTEEDVTNKYKVYNYQFFSAQKLTDTDQFAEGMFIYVATKGSSGDSLTYYGRIVAESIVPVGAPSVNVPVSYRDENESPSPSGEESPSPSGDASGSPDEGDGSTGTPEGSEPSPSVNPLGRGAGEKVLYLVTRDNKKVPVSELIEEKPLSDEYKVSEINSINVNASSITEASPSSSASASPSASGSPEASGSVSPSATPSEAPLGASLLSVGDEKATPSAESDGTSTEENQEETEEGAAATPTVTPTATPDGSSGDSSETPSSDSSSSENEDGQSTSQTQEEGTGSEGQGTQEDGTETSQESSESSAPVENPAVNRNVSKGIVGVDIPAVTGNYVLPLGSEVSDNGDVLGAIKNLTYDFYAVKETNNSTKNTYRISGIDNTGGPYGRRVGYSQVEGSVYNSTNAPKEKGPYYVKLNDEDEYMFMSLKDGEFNFKADYTKSVYQKFTYTGGFTNNEWFKQYVLDREPGAQCDKLYVDVVPVTLDELADNIDNADLIYFAGGQYPKDKDISIDTAIKILDKVVDEDFPIILERSTYYANLADTTITDGNELVNLTLLALNLMQNNVKKVTKEEWVKWYNDIAGVKTDKSDAKYADVVIEQRADGYSYDELSGRRLVAKTDFTDGNTQIDVTYVSTYRSDLLKSMRYPYKPYTYDASNKRTTFVDCSYVNGTIFVNDDWVDSVWAKNDSDDLIVLPDTGKIVQSGRVVWSDFNDQYSDAKIGALSSYAPRNESGFIEIQNEYDSERPVIETYGNWDNFNSKITKATCIRYILNANNSRFVLKSKLRILDLEPYASIQYSTEELANNIYYDKVAGKSVSKIVSDYLTEKWVITNLDLDSEAYKNKIKIDQIGTKEFIGRNIDLNSTYDLIYIGMDTSIMNTKIEDGVKTNETLYNSKKLDGLVYSHVGDRVAYNSWGTNADISMSGNDLTSDKVNELGHYVRSGYAMVVSDDFFNYDSDGKVTGINEDKVDKSSNMYKFIKNVVLERYEDNGDYRYFGRNVFRKGQLEAPGYDPSSTPSPSPSASPSKEEKTAYRTARETLSRFINISKLNIKVNKAPKAYNEGGERNYLTPNPDGSVSLDFEVSLESDASIDASGTSYDCKLYMDLDADGKFESDEELSGLVINNGSEGTSDGKYHLTCGNTYTIQRVVPDEYVGFLAWKLSFILNEKATGIDLDNNASVRSSIEGFSAVKANEKELPKIDVLQIIPNKNQTNYLDLTNLRDVAGNDLYKEVTDFQINIKQISIDDFLRKKDSGNNANKLTYYGYLSQFDMVVLGFTDSFRFAPYNGKGDQYTGKVHVDDYRFKPEGEDVEAVNIIREGIYALRAYILSGKSVLMTHDLTSTNMDTADNIGHAANHNLRDVIGMDRFGKVAEANGPIYSVEMGEVIKQYESEYDYIGLKGSTDGIDNYGYSDANIVRQAGGVGGLSKFGITTRPASRVYAIPAQSKATDVNPPTETVTEINGGQITQYPFLITENVGDTFEVSMTHSQYYQLNLDTNSGDDKKNDDIVVWYAISNTTPENEMSSRDTTHPFYKTVVNDVRNNYYIYTKGNVTYTGSGHSFVSSDQEKKLFINTLVAAYKHGLHAPKVVFKENSWDSSATINSMFLPWDASIMNNDDEATDGWLDQKVSVFFKTINNNFSGSSKELYTKYYIKSDASDYDFKVGSSEYYKEITPVEFKRWDTGDSSQTASPSPLENYKIYEAVFDVKDFNLAGNKDGAGLEGGTALPNTNRAIYIQIGTEELSSGEVEILNATESMSFMDIYTARLFDLE